MDQGQAGGDSLVREGDPGPWLLFLPCDSGREAKLWEQHTSPRCAFGTPNS